MSSDNPMLDTVRLAAGYTKRANDSNLCNITITGDIGSGKSTVARKLADKLNMTVVDSGQLYREFAAERSLSVLEQNNSDDWSIDRKIDSTIKDIGETYDDRIFVSRLAWYFVPNAIKIYLKVNPILAAMRLVKDKRVGESHESIEETLQYNSDRKDAELSRYKEMYNIDDPSGYSSADIICNIGYNSVDDVVELLYEAIVNKDYGYYVDPKCLLPTQVVQDFNIDKVDFYSDAIRGTNCVYAKLSTYKGCTYIKEGHHIIITCIVLGRNFIKTPLPEEVNEAPDVCDIYGYEKLIGSKLDVGYELHCKNISEETELGQGANKFTDIKQDFLSRLGLIRRD